MIRKVTDYLEQTAARLPQKTAISDKKRTLTFAALRDEARHIGTHLARARLFKQPVAIFLDKSVECVAAFLGAAYSGNFYTPIDTGMPQARIEKILSVLEPAAIITDVAHAEQAAAFSCGAPLLFYEEMQNSPVDEACLETVASKIIDADVLYVFFTSGSTGTPKGVTISHRAVIDYTEWVTATFQIDETHIFGNQAPLYFDNSILDLFQMCKTGATLHIIPDNLFMFPPMLLDYMEERKINTIFWVPSALCFVANVGVLSNHPMPSLCKVLFCGEVMPNKQLNIWRKACPNALYANLYGPTEIADVCAYYIIDRFFADDEPLPIGFPCKNTDLLVLDEHNCLVKDGSIGELCVRGTCLAYGYYRNPEKTLAAFVQNPLNTNYPEMIYRTGDLVRYNERGELIYVSRKDFQIKHMGYRIELGEIETAVSALPGVMMNCCLYDTEKSVIVLFYTGEVQAKEILAALKTSLPSYMLPQRMEKLDAMPLNLNGKFDRTALKERL